MKQLLFLLVVSSVGVVGAFTSGPLIGLSVYYLYAVLRPAFLWQWALPVDVAWSQYVAVAVVVATVGQILGVVPLSGKKVPPRVRLALSHVFLAAFAVWVGLSYLNAQSRTVAWPVTVEYSKIFLMYAVGVHVIRSVFDVRVIYLLATAAQTYVAYEANYLYLREGRLDIYFYGFGGLDNNGAGLMLAMGVPLALFAWESTTKAWRWLFLVGVFLLLHAVLLTFSRGAMLSLLLASPLMLLYLRRRRQALLMTLVLLVVVPVFAGQEVRARFFSVREYQEDRSANSRFASWNAAVQMSYDHPLLGVGVRNSDRLSYDYGADQVGRVIHSQYLQILADSGYPALGFYVAAVVGMLIGGRRSIGRLAECDDAASRSVRSMLAGLQCAMVVFCIGAAFLSLEVVELPYVVLLLGSQLSMIALTGGVPDSVRVQPSGGVVGRPGRAFDGLAAQPPRAVRP